ncbi:MAG: anhydro-N-acetylmuramic acid kinase [Planctomycetota bacterium]
MTPFVDADRPRLLLGVNSGTSADAVDFALIEVQGRGQKRQVRLRHSGSAAMHPELQEAIRRFDDWRPSDVGRFHHALGVFFGRAARAFLDRIGISGGRLAAVACHGQTVHHHAGNPADGTLQLGALPLIAAQVEAPVVGDFRWADLAMGGQGAPISPFADWVLFGHEERERVILNLGGISNLTLLQPGRAPLAWDAGPANGPLDALAREALGQPRDEDGRVAAEGAVLKEAFRELQDDPYFLLPPPKSTGLERFGAPFVAQLRRVAPDAAAPALMATLVEVVAWSVASSLREAGWQGGEVYAAGGGVHNRSLWGALERHLGGSRLHRLEELPGGWSGDLREAVAFALLGDAFLLGEAATWPSTTGCRQGAVLGTWCPAGLP